VRTDTLRTGTVNQSHLTEAEMTNNDRTQKYTPVPYTEFNQQDNQPKVLRGNIDPERRKISYGAGKRRNPLPG
jgi:hypothetical protein